MGKMEKYEAIERSARTILVRAPNWIGDQIIAYPFFHFLRRAYPQARIVSACVPWVESVQFRNLVNGVIVLPKPAGSREEANSLLARFKLLERGAKLLSDAGPWDLAISLPNSFSSAWHLFRSDAKVRIGYAVDGRGLLLNRPRNWAKHRDAHRASAYLQLLPDFARPALLVEEFWGVPADNELDDPIPGVIPGFDAAAAWPTSTAIEPPGEPYWVLAPGSVAESRRWPWERFAELALLIYADTKMKGVIVGGVKEAGIAQRIRDEVGNTLLDYTARGSVPDLWKIFKNARFAVTNDSGLAHVAALCGAPVQVVWGAGNPAHTRPLGRGKVRTIFNPVDCWPCESNHCSQELGKKLQCLAGISADVVWKEIRDGLWP